MSYCNNNDYYFHCCILITTIYVNIKPVIDIRLSVPYEFFSTLYSLKSLNVSRVSLMTQINFSSVTVVLGTKQDSSPTLKSLQFVMIWRCQIFLDFAQILAKEFYYPLDFAYFIFKKTNLTKRKKRLQANHRSSANKRSSLIDSLTFVSQRHGY